MTKLISLAAALLALSIPALASANPAPWTDKNKADATVCSTFGRDGTQTVVKPQAGVDSSCVRAGGKDTDAPSATIDSPADGASYGVGDQVTASFSCSDLQSVASCLGKQCPVVDGVVITSACVAVADGGAIDTSQAGSYVFGVQAVDAAGNTATHWTHFTVTPASDGGNGGGSGTGSGSGDESDSRESDSGSSSDTAAGGSASDSSSAALLGEQFVLGVRLAGCNVVLKVRHKQRSLRKRALALTIRSNRGCTVKMSARLIPSKRAGARKAKARTKTVTMKLRAGKAKSVKLRFTKRGLRYLKRSLQGKVTRARIFVTDGARSGQKLNRSFTVRIKR